MAEFRFRSNSELKGCMYVMNVMNCVELETGYTFEAGTAEKSSSSSMHYSHL